MLTDFHGRILGLICERGGLSRTEIAKALGVSKSLVSSAVKDLLRRKLVVETGKEKKEHGRPSVTVSLSENFYLIGLEVEEDFVEAVALDVSGRVHRKFSQSQSSVRNPNELVENIQSVANNLLSELGLSKNQVLGLGIGIAGMVDPRTQVVRTAPALGLADFDLRGALERRLGLRCEVINRVKAAAYAEKVAGIAKLLDDVLFVFIDTGLGAVVLHKDGMMLGHYGKAGELGWMVTAPECTEDFLVDDEGLGPLAKIFSKHSLREYSGRLGIDYHELFRRRDHKLLRALFHFSVALANAVLMLDPQAIVVKGRLGEEYFDFIVDELSKNMERLLPAQFRENIRFERGTFGEYEVAIGAALWVRRSVVRF